MSRIQLGFSALVLAQLAHSIEEYFGRLWVSFPPARFLTGIISPDRRLGFLVINTALLALGVWCLLFPVRKEWPSAAKFLWFWILLETVNGIGHLAWSFREGRYTPGVLTAPLLLGTALYVAVQLRKQKHEVHNYG
jgi:hypothetical protein